MDLSHLRDVMMDSRSLWRTLRAEGTEWRDFERAREAFLRRHPPGRGTVTITGTIARAAQQTEPWSLWLELPDKIRTAFGVAGERATAVMRGTEWWSISSYSPPQTNDGNPKHRHGTGPGYPLTEPRRLVYALELDPHEETTFAGRPAVRVSATPMRANAADVLEQLSLDDAVLELGAGADRYDLLVDSERGVILRSEALLDEAPFLVVEIQEIGFDESFADETFHLEPPPGTTFTSRRFFDNVLGWDEPGGDR